MNKTITVIIPVYNAQDYLDRCLASVAGQSCENLEVLLVDDGSKDNSAKICRRWCERDARFRLISQENRGVSAARNTGLTQAAGEYIAFVDADDWILPDMLEKQLACLQGENSDMVLGGFRTVRTEASEKTIPEKAAKDPDRRNVTTVSAGEYASDWLLAGNNRCWSVLYRKQAIGPVRFQEGLTIGEDLLFLMELLPRLQRVSIMEDRDYCYYINEKGAMLSRFKEQYMDQLRCWQQAEEWAVGQRRPELLIPIRVCLFQAALLVAGKLALLPGRISDREKEYLAECRRAAGKTWRELGIRGRRRLSVGYRVKGALFLASPGLYLKMYHVWKGAGHAENAGEKG